jgi:hypothetical protein
VAVFCLAVVALNAGAITRYVVPVGTPGVTPTNPYDSWAKAATNLPFGVNEGNDGETVFVSNGTYTLWYGAGVSVTRAIRVEAFGGEVVVNGNYPASTNVCLTMNHAAGVVSGLTFSNGYSTLTGGGVVLQKGTLTNCNVVNNFAVNGGGISLPNQANGSYYATAVNCRVFYNLSSNITVNSSSAGGGIALNGSNSLVLNCTIFGNYNAKSGAAQAQGGGGVDMSAGRLVGCMISNNYCTTYGGGVRSGASGYPTLIDRCTISSNRSSLITAAGGGVYAYAGTLITNCVISNNYSFMSAGVSLGSGNSTMTCCTVSYNVGINDDGGVTLGAGCLLLNSTIGPSNVVTASRTGGLKIGGPDTVVSNCVIVGNYGWETAGGVYMTGGLMVNSMIISNTFAGAVNSGGGGVGMINGGRMRNCLVAGNSSLAGGTTAGGVYLYSIGNGGGFVESCTIVSNVAYSKGGGLYLNQTNSYVTNCIVYGNTASAGSDKTDVKYWTTPDTNALAYCLFTSALSPTPNLGNITNANPRFVNAAGGDYRLLPASPCRDAGINQAWMVGATDLDSKARVVPAEGTVDMGAYEMPFQSGSLVNIR